MQRIQDGQHRDAWEQLGWLWTVLFYGALLLSSALSLRDDALTSGERLVAIALLIFLAAWYGAVTWLGQDRIWSNPRLGVPLLLLGIAAWYPLVFIHPAFYFSLAGLFPTLFINLKLSWAIILSALLTVLLIAEQTRGPQLDLADPLVWGFAAATGMAILLGVWIDAIIRQSVRRRELIEQLENTRAQLATAERRAGVLAERERLSREIHDTLSQGFTSIVMHLEAAEQALPHDASIDDVSTLRHHLDRARDTARDSLAQARQVVHDLRPDLLARQSLPEAIERVAARWSEESGIVATTTTTGAVIPLPPEMDVTLLRAAQEALANVRKHARAVRVILTLSYMGDVVVLDVQDDGVGLDAAEPSPLSSGFGLTAMRERVEQLGGVLLVESEPGEGTTLVIEIPIVEGED